MNLRTRINNVSLLILLLILPAMVMSQTLSETQMQNARATGYAIVAARNPGQSFSIYMIPWDGVNTLEYNANHQINTGWHAQAAIKGNYFTQAFDGTNFTGYSTVITSQEEFDIYKSNGTQWWIVCSTLEPFAATLHTSGGSVGVGTATPFSGSNNQGLHLAKGGHSSLFLGNPQNENRGGIVQTSDDKHRVFIGANLYDDQSTSWKSFDANKGSAGISILADKGGWGAGIDFCVSDLAGDYNTRLHINSSGNVGIGTTSPAERLAVNGNIRAREIKVENTNWPDYVFAASYQLRDLKATEQFIKENKHLPEMPSAKEVEKNGISLGEMDSKLLKKIEELTLYIIDLNKKLGDQQTEIRKLKAK